MNIGMLWFSNDPDKSLAEKVGEAAEYYRAKYGQVATVCFVHPTMLPEPLAVNGVQVEPNGSVLPNHFWIGVRRE